MTEQDLLNAGFIRTDVPKEESNNEEDFHYYVLNVTEGITLVSDSPAENGGEKWTVESFEIEHLKITEPEQLFNFLETMKICTLAN